MNKRMMSVVTATFILASGLQIMAQEARVSPHDTASVVLEGDNGVRAMVVYGRPYTKNPRSGEVRKIWGTLVPFGKVWRVGADEATLFVTPRALDMNGTKIPAGTYSLWLLPQADSTAKLIINKEFGQWGESYDEKQDFARIDMKREPTDKSVDQFTITLDGKPETGFTMKLAWESTQYTVAFTVQK